MSRIMYDSTSIGDIPTSATMVAYYVDGIYAVSEATVKARFPNAILVGISAVGTDAGIVGDVEPGCMTVAQGVLWVKFRRAANADPTIYCNEMNAWAGIRQAFKNAGVAEPHYWVADYDDVPTLPAGAIAKQYANPTLTGGHYDKSIVADHWPGVDTLKGESDMTLFVRNPSGAVYIIDGAGKRHVQRPEYIKWAALYGSEAALKVQDITAADLATIVDVSASIPGPIGPAGPAGLTGVQGSTGPKGDLGVASTVPGPQGPPGTVPQHKHDIATTGPMEV